MAKPKAKGTSRASKPRKSATKSKSPPKAGAKAKPGASEAKPIKRGGDFLPCLQPFKDLLERELFKAPGSIEQLIAEEPNAKTREVLNRLHTASAMELLREFFPDPEKHRCILGSLVASAVVFAPLPAGCDPRQIC